MRFDTYIEYPLFKFQGSICGRSHPPQLHMHTSLRFFEDTIDWYRAGESRIDYCLYFAKDGEILMDSYTTTCQVPWKGEAHCN